MPPDPIQLIAPRQEHLITAEQTERRFEREHCIYPTEEEYKSSQIRCQICGSQSMYFDGLRRRPEGTTVVRDL